MSSSVPAVQPGRIRVLKQSADARPAGPVVYWMFRDQRLKDNWALIHAVHQANQWEVPVAIAFNLFNQFKGAKARQLGFMLRGLKKLHSDLQSTLDIPFYLFQASLSFRLGCPAESGMVSRVLGILVEAHFTSHHYVEVRQWKEEICKRVNESVSIQEVDAHNARFWCTSNYMIRQGAEVPELEWCEPGERAALEVLMGDKTGFLKARLKNYSTDRNNPLKPKGLSGLSPYLHFGQISAQRCALEARKVRKLNPQLVVTAILKAVDAFLEELIVRRELADNFCFYQPHYDSLQGAWEWARKTLMDHAADKREHLYTREQLEKAQTADPVSTHPIHLFLSALECFSVRNGLLWKDAWMYWAKKILEWTSGPEEALATAIYLNDKQYHIDGRDPNGYVGCMWSICGVHDQRTVGECKKRKAEALLNNKAKELRS
ncbi:hypothetical protein DH2020_005368 [Rehmannia glutinosa]|uniref:Photolyase/cryptochrome alpha/beta domain-containing protein n=1 Tax=Rehmannia glutinosa TaxID=99300 RepID=A0ABR0XFV4_REHGL